MSLTKKQNPSRLCHLALLNGCVEDCSYREKHDEREKSKEHNDSANCSRFSAHLYVGASCDEN